MSHVPLPIAASVMIVIGTATSLWGMSDVDDLAEPHRAAVAGLVATVLARGRATADWISSPSHA